MFNLGLYPEFRSDIQGNTTNIHPVIKIESNPPIYISQNEEVLSDAGEPKKFQALNLRIPSIKESIDLESRNFKINNVTITLANTFYIENYNSQASEKRTLFSDLFATQNF